MIKTLKKLENREELSQLEKNMYRSPRINMMLKRKRTFSLGNKEKICVLLLLFNIVPKVLTTAVR